MAGENPWKDGIWQAKSTTSYVYHFKGGKAEMKNLASLDHPEVVKPMATALLKSGDFGEAPKNFQEASGGVKNFNLEMEYPGMGSMPCLIFDNGTKILSYGKANDIETLELLDEDGMKKLKDNREPYDAPSCPHITPGKPGKMFWLSGPPGCGKSTTSQLLARKNGLVYFEADCCLGFTNPFVDPNVDEPSVAAGKQKPLKDIPQDIIEAFDGWGEMMAMIYGGNLENIDAKYQPLVMAMTRMIRQQHKRLGGTWSIAQAVPTRKLRELARGKLGKDLVFIVMNLSKECQKERIKYRHSESDEATLQKIFDFYDCYEPAGDDEENAVNIDITEDMSKEEVLEKVLAAMNAFKN